MAIHWRAISCIPQESLKQFSVTYGIEQMSSTYKPYTTVLVEMNWFRMCIVCTIDYLIINTGKDIELLVCTQPLAVEELLLNKAKKFILQT